MIAEVDTLIRLAFKYHVESFRIKDVMDLLEGVNQMSVKEHIAALMKEVDATIKEIHTLYTDGELPDEDAKEIVDGMQEIEDKLSNLLAEYGVEIGDERID